MNTNTPGSKIYFEFKSKLIDQGGYMDSFYNDYQYSYSSNGALNNGSNNYDLWSYGGSQNNPTNKWIKNW
jgi:hypothetical protein